MIYLYIKSPRHLFIFTFFGLCRLEKYLKSVFFPTRCNNSIYLTAFRIAPHATQQTMFFGLVMLKLQQFHGSSDNNAPTFERRSEKTGNGIKEGTFILFYFSTKPQLQVNPQWTTFSLSLNNMNVFASHTRLQALQNHLCP